MKCRCCGSSELQLILDLGDQPWGNDYVAIGSEINTKAYPLRFLVCKKCYMAQIDTTIPKEIMFVNHTYVSGTTKSLKRHFVEVGDSILRRNPFGPGDYILDVGGNDGTFLELFRDNSIRVLNVDSGILQAKISAEKNIPCVNTFFNKEVAEKILRERGKAAVIHGSGIFFHLEELHSVFDGLKLLLRPDGFIVAEFIYLPSMVENCAYDQIYHEHLLYYSLSNFQKLLDRFELEIFDAELKPIHGGSCIAYVGHKKQFAASERFLSLRQKEIDDGFESVNAYFRFAEAVANHRTSLVSMLKDLRQKNLRVQALGAPVKGSTMINYCGLTTAEIECGVEINHLKFNTYFPGTKIPVYDQNTTKPPDVYLLLAWNFKDEILPKLEAFRRGGGKILIPIPSPELI